MKTASKQQRLLRAQELLLATLKRVGYSGKFRGESPFEIPCYKTENRHPLSNQVGSGYAIKEKVYSGDLLIGLATMHKSNIVPIMKKSEAVEISQMRRS